eukprot:scaffold12939_cov63-Phaeocystis_antarctica.AAC.1
MGGKRGVRTGIRAPASVPRPQDCGVALSACMMTRRVLYVGRTEPPLLVARCVCTLLHHLQHELRVGARLGGKWCAARSRGEW